MVKIKVRDNFREMVNIVAYLEINWTSLEVSVDMEDYGRTKVWVITVRTNQT